MQKSQKNRNLKNQIQIAYDIAKVVSIQMQIENFF